MKNSSRLVLTMVAKRRRSRAGTRGSAASARTRSLNLIQESSRLKKRDSEGGASSESPWPLESS
ncbi:MAG: hypothetical protein A3A86_08210 [Elusimicrobia bacterium RIFCSPLOWO2_01_FULL_60_11]|nr:MAG: hypothetical protein A3A86_08210 [Elusimicrobia bacterium RIFCSPLOWO2_01_FULL_60_11]